MLVTAVTDSPARLLITHMRGLNVDLLDTITTVSAAAVVLAALIYRL